MPPRTGGKKGERRNGEKGNRPFYPGIWRISAVFWLLLWFMGCGGRPDPFGQQVTRATELSIQGQEWFSQGDQVRAARSFGRALDISRAIDYPPGVAQQLNNLGAVALEQGNPETARQFFTQALLLNQNLRNWTEASVNLANLATVAQTTGDRRQAEQYLQEAQEAAQRSGSREAQARVLCQLAGFYLDQGDPATTAALLEQARPLAVTPALQGMWQHHQGRLSLAQGDTLDALAHFNRALDADREILDRAAMAADLYGLGEAYQAQGAMAQAFTYYSRAFGVYAGLGKRAQLQKCLARLRQVNAAGQLGRSLERFEHHPQLKPSSPD